MWGWGYHSFGQLVQGEPLPVVSWVLAFRCLDCQVSGPGPCLCPCLLSAGDPPRAVEVPSPMCSPASGLKPLGILEAPATSCPTWQDSSKRRSQGPREEVCHWPQGTVLACVAQELSLNALPSPGLAPGGYSGSRGSARGYPVLHLVSRTTTSTSSGHSEKLQDVWGRGCCLNVWGFGPMKADLALL